MEPIEGSAGNSEQGVFFEAATAKTEAHPKKKLKKYIFSALFMLILIALTFYIMFKDNSARDIMNVLRRANIYWVVGGVLVMFLCRTFQGLALGKAANCLGYKMTLAEMLQYSYVGVFYGAITPLSAGAQPMQFYYMCRDKMSISSATLMMFTINIVYQTALVSLGLIMFTLQYSYIVSVNSGLVLLFALGFLLHFASILILAAVIFSESILRRIVNLGVKVLSAIHLIKDKEKALSGVEKYISDVKKGTEIIRRNKGSYIIVLLLTFGQILCYHFVPFFVYKSFGMNTGQTFIDIVSYGVLLFIAVSILPLPGMVGASERGFVILYKYAFAGNIVAATLLSRFINFYFFLAVSGLVAIYVHFRVRHNLEKRRKITDEETALA